MSRQVIFQNSSDTAWKEILDGLYRDFIEYCLPELSRQIDWRQGIISLDKEFHAIVKDNLTGTNFVDKLVKVFLSNNHEQWILIHVEVQGTPDKNFSKRMFIYACRIYDRYQQPLVSCAVLTDEKKQWRPSYYEVATYGTKIRLDFLVLKLIDYHGQKAELERSKNPFASVLLSQLTALETKKLPNNEKLNIKYNLTKRLYGKGYHKETIKKLYLFLDWLIHLSPEFELEYKQAVYQLEESIKMRYISTIERMGIEEGLQKGLQKGKAEGKAEGIVEGKAELLMYLLAQKFGELAPDYRECIGRARPETLMLWVGRILEAKSLQDVFMDEEIH